jgi:filamentous hemagglutinin family protein
MKRNFLWLLSSIIFSCVARSTLVSAQIIPDPTTNTQIEGNCVISCRIVGGVQAGINLFQSFQEFNIDQGAKVEFIDLGAQNIFSRITGENASRIFGTLGVSNSNANLFLINPNGIIFGNEARLDLKGSFVATTADAIRFGDLGSFTAKPSLDDNPALLTIEPSAFLFQQRPTTPNPIEVRQGAILRVEPQQNLLLLGDFLQLQGGILVAPSGNIILGAVTGEGQIGINAGESLEMGKNVQKGDINLDQGAIVDVSGLGGGNIYLHGNRITLDRGSQLIDNTIGNFDGGTISIEAQNLSIRDGSFISATTFNKGTGGNISIEAQETVEIIGQPFIPFQQFLIGGLSGRITPETRVTGLFTGTAGEGNAGNITVKSQNLIVGDGAVIFAPTFGDATAGNIWINTEESVEIRASGLLTASNISTSGSAGDIQITTQKLLVRDGGAVLASTFGSGQGGDLTVLASDLIELVDTPPTAFLPNGLYSSSVFSTGQGGNVYLTTDRLFVRNGSTIAAASGAFIRDGIIPVGGSSGNISIQAGAIELNGASIDGVFPSRIISDTFGTGDGGNLTIATDNLQVVGNAYISATAFGHGNGGDLTIQARDFIRLQGTGFAYFPSFLTNAFLNNANLIQGTSALLTGTTGTGNAGNAIISTPYLLLENGAALITSSFGVGKGGSLTIQAERIEVFSSIINAGSIGTGDGSDLMINTKTLTIVNSSTVGTTTLGRGNAGNATIRATESIEIYDNADYQPSFFGVRILPGIYTASLGGANAGNLEVDTKNLRLRNGGSIASQSILNPFTLDPNVGSGGNITIRAQSIEIDGQFSDGLSSSGLFTSTSTNGNAGDLQVIADVLKLSDTGTIGVNSDGLGAAGNLFLQAETIQLDSGNITASSISGVGGNIDLRVGNSFWLTNSSQIDANARGFGDGGNISITAPILVLLNRSRINASAIEGDGGRINIDTQGLFRSSETGLEASSQLGIDGVVSIDTPDIDINSGLLRLSEATIHSENSIVQTCNHNSPETASRFVILGKGGSIEQPQQIRSSLPLLEDFGITIAPVDVLAVPSPAQDRSNTLPVERNSFIEARGWLKNSQGQIILTATANHPNNTVSSFDRSPDCPSPRSR